MNIGDTTEKKFLSNIWFILLTRMIEVGGIDYLEQCVDKFLTIYRASINDPRFVIPLEEPLIKLYHQIENELQAKEHME